MAHRTCRPLRLEQLNLPQPGTRQEGEWLTALTKLGERIPRLFDSKHAAPEAALCR